MKKNIFLLFISFLYLGCAAQTKLLPGEAKGDHDTFIVHEFNLNDPIPQLSIYSKYRNKNNDGTRRSKVPNPIPMNPRDIHVNTDAIKPIVYTVLNKKLNSLKQSKEELGFLFIFNQDGTMSDIAYTLHANTQVTAQDLEEIDRQLRLNIKAIFTGQQYLQFETIVGNIIPDIKF